MTRGKRPGGKRFGGETTRVGNGLGAKRPRFCHNIMLVYGMNKILVLSTNQ